MEAAVKQTASPPRPWINAHTLSLSLYALLGSDSCQYRDHTADTVRAAETSRHGCVDLSVAPIEELFFYPPNNSTEFTIQNVPIRSIIWCIHPPRSRWGLSFFFFFFFEMPRKKRENMTLCWKLGGDRAEKENPYMNMIGTLKII